MAMRIKKKRPPIKQKPSPPKLVKTDELCKELAAMAAFALYDNPAAQEKVYKAIRQLQLLDAAAIKAGILPA